MADNLNSTEDRIIQLSGLIQDLYTDYNKQIQDLITKLTEVDVNNPDALDQIQAIRVEYRTARGAFNRAVGPLLAEITSLNATLTPEEQAKVASYVQAAKDATTTKFDKTNTDFNNTRENVKTDAEEAAAKKNEEIKANAAKTPVQTEEQNKEYEASGGEDDDQGGSQGDQTNNTVTDTQYSETDPRVTPGTPPPPPVTPTTVAGKSGTDAAKKSNPSPRLRKNPLGDLSSYTYQLTLYMISPDAYNAFVMSGKKDINAFQTALDAENQRIDTENANTIDNSNRGGGAGAAPKAKLAGGGVYVVAQSGGVGPGKKRAPGFEEDFFIDDLRMVNNVNGKSTLTAVNVTKMDFTITEPYGFSFLSKLQYAHEQLKKVCKVKNYQDSKNPTKQFFILGVRFLGYDKNGSLVNSKDIPGAEGDPTANQFGLFERYFDIYLTKVSFKMDGKSVIYNITASCIADSPFGTKRGLVENGTTIIGNTVYEVLKGSEVIGGGVTKNNANPNADRMGQAAAGQYMGNKIGLLTSLNETQKKQVGNAIEIANEWDVKFIGGAEDLIAKASIVSPNDLNKHRWGRNPQVTNTKESNDANGAKPGTPDPNSRTIQIIGGTPILQCIENIIKQSSYMEKALKTVNIANEELKQGEGGKQTIRWFNLSAEVEVLGWDSKVGDFAYRTTYVIQPYETPTFLSTYANGPAPYYGPHKRYHYMYTGQNSEIISFTQQFDNTFFTVTLNPNGSPSSQAGSVDVATKGNQPQSGDKSGGEAGGQSVDPQNSYITSLHDPSALANAKLTIIGDPDYLMQTSTSSLNSLYNKYNGTDGFTINPNGGQVFIEIDFNEPKDYNMETGLLNINNRIKFWEYPDSIKDQIQGIAYMVIDVTSRFSKGKFEQDLNTTIATFPELTAGAKGTGAKDTNQSDAETNRLAAKNATLAPNGDATNESNAETARNNRNNSLLANAPVDQTNAETNRLNRQSASIPTMPDGVGTSPLTPYASQASSNFLDPAQQAQLSSLNSVGSINNVMDPSQRPAPNQTITISTPTGQVQDDEAGIATNLITNW